MHFLPQRFRFPEPLADALAEHFWQTNSPSESKLVPTGRALAELWPRLAQGRGQEKTRHYSFTPDTSTAYAAYYLPANLMKIPLILAEAESFGLNLFGKKPGETWVDIGCGPGTAFAGLAWWAQHRAGPSRVVGIDQSPQFLKIASELQADFSKNLERAIPTLQSRKAGRDPEATLELALAEDPELISFVNSIGEIFPDLEERTSAIRDLVRALAQKAKQKNECRYLLIVEPGAHDASRELLQLRDAIREEANVDILLPCLDNRACGALAKPKDWCHEEVACEFPEWLNDLGKGAGMRKEAMVFSYLLVAIGKSPRTEAWPVQGWRMVSQRLEHKGLTECWFCTKEGKKRTRLSHAVQKKREIPLPLPSRGNIYSELQISEKGEIESMQSANLTADFSELFPS